MSGPNSPERHSSGNALRTALLLVLAGAAGGCATLQGFRGNCSRTAIEMGDCMPPKGAVSAAPGQGADAGGLPPPPDGLGGGPKPPAEVFLDGLPTQNEPSARMAVQQFLTENNVRIASSYNYNRDDAINSLIVDVLTLQELRRQRVPESIVSQVKRKFADTVAALPAGSASVTTFPRGASLMMMAQTSARICIHKAAYPRGGVSGSVPAPRPAPSAGAPDEEDLDLPPSPRARVPQKPPRIRPPFTPGGTLHLDQAAAAADGPAIAEARTRMAQYRIDSSYDKTAVERFVAVQLLTVQAMNQKLTEMRQKHGQKVSFPAFEAAVLQAIRKEEQSIDGSLRLLQQPGTPPPLIDSDTTLSDKAKMHADGVIGGLSIRHKLTSEEENAGSLQDELRDMTGPDLF